MWEVVNDLLTRTARGGPLSTDDIMRLILLGGMVFATTHLVTMLVTRWGDRNTAFKSLLFSILVHISCWTGLVTIPPSAVEAAPEPEEIQRQVEIRNLLVESEESVRTDQSGNTPVWEKLAPDERDPTRLEHDSPDLKPLESAERTQEQVTPSEIEIDDVADRTEADSRASIPEDSGQQGPIQTSSPAMEVNEEVAESRPEVRPNEPVKRRSPVQRIGRRDTSVTREAVSGSTERIDSEVSPIRESPEIDAIADPRSFLVESSPGDTVRRRTGPVASDQQLKEVGAPTENTEEGAPGSSARRRFSRISPGRSRRADPTSPVERQRMARTPVPLDSDYDRVRLSPTRDPFSESLEVRLARPRFDAPSNRRGASIPATYRLRSLEKRRDIARRFGGTDESEQAVELSLRWLSEQQQPDGSWDASRFGSGQVKIDDDGVDRRNAGREADTGITALTILAFLGAGYTREEGKYADTVDKALEWLVDQQDEEGNLAGDAIHHARMYCHAIATYAIAEAYAMQSDQTVDTRLRGPLLHAVEFIISQQNPRDGGWRYIKGQDGDMSMFGWQLMGLKSAELAGVRIPPEVRTRMARFLQTSAQGESGGLAAYRADFEVTPTMTAEALFCRQMLGYPQGSRANREAISYMLRNLPSRSTLNLYYWYYGTLAMYQYGGDAWERWNDSLRDLLVSEQRKSGNLAGSWDPRGPWGPYGGRLYSTTLSTLTLEVYYRFLPLYRMGEPQDNRTRN